MGGNSCRGRRPRRPAGGCKHPPQQTPLWQKAAAILVWILIWQLAAMGLGHGGLFLATPLQTLGALAQLAPTAAFWQRIVFSALRIMAGFLLAAAGGLLLGAAGARWHWVRVFIDPAMQLIRAMPVASFVILALLWVRSANLSVIVSFTHVLPVVYAGVLGGIADTDPKLLEMAKVYRLPLTARLRYIWLPGIFPSFCESCIAAMGMCWKSGVSAEVIGLPDHSVGDALYRAKITLSTPDVFAWTLVIVLLSAALFGEPLTTRKWLAAGLTFSGLVVTLGLELSGQPLGIVLGVASALIYSCYILLGGRFTTGSHPISAACVVFLAASVSNGLIVLAQGDGLVWPHNTAGWLALLAIALICTVLAIVGFLIGIKRIGATQASMISTFEPVVTVLLAAAWLGEAVTLSQLLGGVLILAGVWLLSRPAAEVAVSDIHE